MSNEVRLDRMRESMAAGELDALILRLPENVLLLSGYWPMISVGLLVFPLAGKSTSIIPDCYKGEAEASLWESSEPIYIGYGCTDSPDYNETLIRVLASVPGSSGWRRVGYESDFEVVAPSWNSAEGFVPMGATANLLRSALPHCELVDASALLRTNRLTKTDYEIKRLRIASEISCIGMRAFEDAVTVGVSGVELVAEVERAVMAKGTGYAGTTRVRAYAQVTTGCDETILGYRPNIVSTVRKMKDGDVALLELGLVADGYWADRTRVRVAGTPTDEQHRIFNTVLRAQEAATSTAAEGVRAADVDRAARSIIEDAGYGSFFPHVTGHGVGFGYHEAAPLLSPSSSEILLSGMMTSVEPGIYHKPSGGFRIEDDIIITKDGAEVLGPYRKSLT